MDETIPSIPKSDLTLQIYGIEPTHELHSILLDNIRAHGLEDIYTIVPCGIEDTDRLRSFGLADGTIDTVLSVQVLCGVPQPRDMIKRLYAMLKPGGKMIVYEHVRAVDRISLGVQSKSLQIWWTNEGSFACSHPHSSSPIPVNT